MSVVKLPINKRRSIGWSSSAGNMVKCPVSGCEHIGQMITKVHCRNVHNLERYEVKKLYGMPFLVPYNPGALLGLGTTSGDWYSTRNSNGNLI